MTKRKNIVGIAHDLNLTGLSMPGKPGVVIIEGLSTSVQEWVTQVRSWNWKKSPG